MSSYVDREWFYYLRGRELLLYKLLGGSSNERITQDGILRTRGKELMYPNEDIASGLRVEYTALNEPFVSEALETTTAVLSGITIDFENPDISDSGNAWITSGFENGDRIRVQGSSSNDGDYTINSIGANTITITDASPSGNLVTETAGERITVTQISKEDTTPDATSHINLNKMLSLAVVDYCKAMMAERNGEIDKKEYFMKEFYSKLADNESNKRIISVASPISAFAVK